MQVTSVANNLKILSHVLENVSWPLAERAALVSRSYEPGMSVSLMVRQEGVVVSLLFQWRKLER